MVRQFRLRPLPGSEELEGSSDTIIDRRQFMRHSFNTAAGVITMASLGSIGFASLLMGATGSSGGDSAVRFWVPTGAEDSTWYGDRHLEAMSYSAFVDAAASSNTGMAGAQGVWSGLPVNVVYVPHEENSVTPVAMNKPRFQFVDGYTESGKYVASVTSPLDSRQFDRHLLSLHTPLLHPRLATGEQRLHQTAMVAGCCRFEWQQIVLHLPLEQVRPNNHRKESKQKSLERRRIRFHRNPPDRRSRAGRITLDSVGHEWRSD